MNKQELINAIAADTGMTKTAVKIMLQSFEFRVTEALANGNEVKMIGFGTFKARPQPARIGRNPATGGEVEVPAKKRVSFIAGKGLKEAVNL
ncbi:MAG: HU family DNA-binding protein [Psychrobacter sp.]|uniref:HU family DNA-binding protein n=1 Tax=Psychrobacter sp. TaxID=56811 RepID=UPI002647FD3A|nr:HU family DNA-binding protein [Psychrobacter sp.]MDN5619067.1 HU family DNA-binding protein [Psychrobacter sp.]